MKSIYPTLLFFALAGACSNTPAEPSVCSARRLWWTENPGTIHERGEKGVIHLSREGVLTFNGIKTDFSGLESYLDKLRRRTASWVSFRHETGVDCDELEAIRTAVERRFDCRDANCLEDGEGDPPPPPDEAAGLGPT